MIGAVFYWQIEVKLTYFKKKKSELYPLFFQGAQDSIYEIIPFCSQNNPVKNFLLKH